MAQKVPRAFEKQASEVLNAINEVDLVDLL